MQQLNKAQEELYGTKNENENVLENEKYDLNIQNIKPRPLTPYYEHRKELRNYPHQQVNLDKSKIPELELNILQEEKKHQAAILLQRLLRGRAIQNSMFDGKEKRLALIEELLIVANIDHLEKEQEDEIIESQLQKDKMNSLRAGIEGKIISESTDAMARRLIRQ